MAADELDIKASDARALGGVTTKGFTTSEREGSPSVSSDSLASFLSRETSSSSGRLGMERESMSPEPSSAEVGIAKADDGKGCHQSEAWARDLYYKNELVNVKRSFRERMLVMKVRMKEEEAALKRKIAQLEGDAAGLLADNARLSDVEEENRSLRETVTNLVTVLAESNKPAPKRLKLC